MKSSYWLSITLQVTIGNQSGLTMVVIGMTLVLMGLVSTVSSQPPDSTNIWQADLTDPLAGTGQSPDSGTEPEIKDPFFNFLIDVMEHDSLGVWNQEDIQSYTEQMGRESVLPLHLIHNIERRKANEKERESRRGAKVTRIWTVTFDEALDLPMPYSILGYHPGSLIVSRVIRVSEWYLGGPNIHVVTDGVVAIHPISDLRTLRLDSGWIILDVDGWLDKILGKKLDDAWTQGFAVCRIEGQLCGISLGVSRKERPLFGEFDFRKDQVISDQRPIPRSIHHYVRPWVAPPDGAVARIWQYEK